MSHSSSSPSPGTQVAQHHSMPVKSRPIHEIRFGRIVAAIWENRTEQGSVRHNVTVCRIYKNNDQWKETQSFGREDLPVVAKVLDRCHTWIFEHPSSQG